MRRSTPLVVICMLLLGCAPKVEVTPFGPLPDEPTATVEVFMSRAAIDRQYREIALITVDDEGWEKGEAKLLNLAISEAKRIGANGIIVLGQDQRNEGVYVTPDQGYGQVAVPVNRRVVRVVAIVFSDGG